MGPPVTALILRPRFLSRRFDLAAPRCVAALTPQTQANAATQAAETESGVNYDEAAPNVVSSFLGGRLSD